MAHTNFGNVGIGTSMLLTHTITQGVPLETHPPEGIILPIQMADNSIVKAKVISSTREEFVIELNNGHRGRLTRLGHDDQPTGVSGFPGTEWVLRERIS